MALTTKEKVSQFLQTRINSIRNAIDPNTYGSFTNKNIIQPLAKYQQSNIGQSHIKAGLTTKKLLLDNPRDFGTQMANDISDLVNMNKPNYQMRNTQGTPLGNLKNQASRTLGTGSFIAGAGNPLGVVGMTALGGGINYASNKYIGKQDDKTALNNTIASTVEALPKSFQMAGISRFTNPLIDKAGLLGKGFVARNLIKSPLNVGEGYIMDRATGYETTPQSMAIDAIFPVASDLAGVIFKSSKDAMRGAEFKIMESIGNGARNKGGMYTTLEKFVKGTRPYRKAGQTSLGALAGVETYQDEQGNWKVRFNGKKAGIGMAIMMGVSKSGDMAEQALKNVDEGKPQIPQELQFLSEKARTMPKEQFKQLFDAGLKDQNLTRREVAQKSLDLMKKNGITIDDFYVKSVGKPQGLDAQKYLYHGTNSEMLDSISKEGLKPSMKGTLSLSKEEAYAKSFARDGITPQGKTDATMLRVNEDLLKGKTLSSNKPRPASDQLNEILTKEVIPPESLEIYKNGKWQPLINQSKVGVTLDTSTSKTIAQDDRFKKLNDLMNYNDRLVKEAGLSPEQASKLSVKQGMDILEGRAKVEKYPELSPQIPQELLQNQVRGMGLNPSSKQQVSNSAMATPQRYQPQRSTGELQGTTVLQGTEMARQSQQLSTKSNQIYPSLEDIVRQSGTDVKSKVNPLDYLRTPEKVLNKIGLGNEARLIRNSYDSYLKELPQEINKITEWSKQVTPESNQKIFRFLDGQSVSLDKNELRVANEIKTYLGDWADKLGLPEDKRIASYITHIFEKDFIQKEFDPDIAKLIRDRVAGSVYDPFLESRLGKMGYVEDTWKALDAYVKRAVRKTNIDPALDQVKAVANSLEESQYDYVKSYIDKINMRPSKIDNLIDNGVKQIFGYKFGQRPVALLSKKIRQQVYRGTLGLNIGSAVKNLTQGVNTYSELGEKYTIIGYTRLAKDIMGKSDELERVGVLKNDFIEDRSISATKKFAENFDKTLFSVFEFAEKINRGAAYYGAKAKGISKGMDEEQAINYAKEIVRKTQFTFGSVDTPVALQNDVVKFFSQFQSFNIKQTEFLASKIAAKDVAGLFRYSLASVLVATTVGKAIGMDLGDMIPFSGVLTGETKLGQTPAVNVVRNLVGAPDKYGNRPENPKEYISNVGKSLIPLIPAGVQIKKTIEGVGDVSKGYSETATGKVKYPVNQTTGNLVSGAIFGRYTFPEAREYYDKNRSALSANQSTVFKQEADRKAFYDKLMQTRVDNKEEDKIKDQVRKTSQPATTSEKFYYYDQDSEQVRTIKLNPKIEPPKLTGDVLYDKKLTSTYNSSITSAQSDIIKLAELGQMIQEDAIKEINNLEKLRIVAPKKGKKLKVVKPKKVTFKKTKKTKLAKLNIKPIGTTRQKSTLWATPKLKAPSGVNLEELRNPKV